MSDIVKYEQHGAVVVITLNRPDAMNSFTSQLSFDLLDALEKAHHDDDTRVVVLTGEGRCFSAGADLKSGFEGRRVFGKLQYEYRPVMSAIATMPKPVIAAVPGSAAGIGLSLALTCDLLVMADNAFLLSPFTTISLVPAVPADDLQAAALEWATMLAERAPLSLAATKKVMRHALDHDWASSFDAEAELQQSLVGCDDNLEGVQAFFEKRGPEFKGK
jgi:2-(1,2-epoxy-1,2-dihydrophenyl)acetyl-CoA isomerase